jgi:hypothetical protein
VRAENIVESGAYVIGMGAVQFDLLDVLDAFVRRDDGPPGFAGKVYVGTDAAGGPRWWRGAFAERAEASFVPRLGEDADVAVFFGRAEARSILETGRLPRDPRRLFLFGEERLLKRMLARYAKEQSWLDVRLGGLG